MQEFVDDDAAYLEWEADAAGRDRLRSVHLRGRCGEWLGDKLPPSPRPRVRPRALRIGFDCFANERMTSTRSELCQVTNQVIGTIRGRAC